MRLIQRLIRRTDDGLRAELLDAPARIVEADAARDYVWCRVDYPIIPSAHDGGGLTTQAGIEQAFNARWEIVNQQASETHGQGDLIKGLEQVFSILLPKQLKSSDSCVTVLPDSKLRGSILLKS